MAYPADKTTFTDPVGTNTLDNPDLATGITSRNAVIEALEDVVGTTLGTNVLKSFATGEFPIRATGVSATGTLQQTVVGGTVTETKGSVNLQVGTIGTLVGNTGTIGTLIPGTITTVNSIPGSALSTNAILLGYSALTGTQTLTTETVLSGGTLAITNPSGGRRIKVTLFIANNSSNVANTFSTYRIIEAGGTIQTTQQLLASAGNGETVTVLWSGTASAGAHTYTASCVASTGTVTITNNASIVSFFQAELI